MADPPLPRQQQMWEWETAPLGIAFISLKVLTFSQTSDFKQKVYRWEREREFTDGKGRESLQIGKREKLYRWEREGKFTYMKGRRCLTTKSMA